MLGRAATRIELNRDADLEELEFEKDRRERENQQQIINNSNHHQ